MATEIVTVAVPRIPRIHDPAPDFEATSAPGIIRLSDYTSKGKWILLFSHPADFTPVCTTEFVEFARAIPSLRSATYNCWATQWTASILTLWVRNIEEHFKLKVPFPVIADLDQKTAVTYGMVHEAVSDTAAVLRLVPRDVGADLQESRGGPGARRIGAGGRRRGRDVARCDAVSDRPRLQPARHRSFENRDLERRGMGARRLDDL